MRVGTKLAAMSCATALIFLIIGGASYFSFSQLIETNKWLLHSEKVLLELSTLQAHLGDAESNERAFLITGREELLQAYELHHDEIPKSLDRLESMFSDNEHQLQRVQSIRPLLMARLRFMDDTVEIYKENGMQPAMEKVRGGKGITLQNNALNKIAELIHDELDLRNQRNISVERSIGNSRLTIILGIVLGIVFVSFCNFIIGQDIAICINQLISSAENMARGRFESITAVDTQDEFGALALTFSNLGQRLQKLTEDALNREKLVQNLSQLVDDAGRKLDALSERAEELLNNVKQKLIESHDRPHQIADMLSLVKQGAERTTDLEKMAESVASLAGKSKQSCDSSLNKMHELLAAVDSLAEKARLTSSSAASFADNTDSLAEMSVIMESITAELNLFSMTAAIDSGEGQDARTRLAVVVEKLNKLAESSKQDSIKIKQMLSKIQLSAGKTLMSSQDTSNAASSMPRVIEQLSQSLDKISQTTNEAHAASEPLIDAAEKHVLDMTELPYSLTRLLNDVEGQVASVKQAELMLAELRESIKTTGSLLTAGQSSPESSS